MGDSSSSTSSSTTSSTSRPMGPLGIDPLHFSAALFALLFLFVLYLLLPRGVRVQYFGGYPKRYAWSARSRGRRRKGGDGASMYGGSSVGGASNRSRTTGAGNAGNANASGSYTGRTRADDAGERGLHMGINTPMGSNMGGSMGGMGGMGGGSNMGGSMNPPSTIHAGQSSMSMNSPISHTGHGNLANLSSLPSTDPHATHTSHTALHSHTSTSNPPNDDIVVSAAMQQLRDPGVLIVAHGSRGKPKTVRLVLTETAITWRTEMRKKSTTPSGGKELKLGKLHQVPLSHIMYVDVGKQTTALRRVENASVSESLCFSLLTKEGSLDLEANSPRERDALVSCFSLVLDEVHAQNWRDIYRGPSSDMPSSFDEGDGMMGGGGGVGGVGGGGVGGSGVGGVGSG